MVVGVLEQVHCGFAELVQKNSDQMTKVPRKQIWSSEVLYFFCSCEEITSPFSILVSQPIEVAMDSCSNE